MATSDTYQYSYPLYNMAVGWWGRRSINPLSFIAPVVKVEGTLGTLKRFPQSSIFRAVDTSRAMYQEAARMDIEAEDVPFLLQDHALKLGVDDRTIKGTGPRIEATERVAASRLGSLLKTWELSMIADGFNYFRKEVPITTAIGDVTDVGHWSDDNKDPLEDLKAVISDFVNNNGVYPNRILIPRDGFTILNENPFMMDKVENNSTKTLTNERLLELLELDGDDMVEPIRIMRGVVPIGKQKAGPGVEFQGTNLLGNDVWITYAQETQEPDDISGLKTLSDGGTDIVTSVETWYDWDRKTTWYRCDMNRAFLVTAPSTVYRLSIS